MPSKLNAISTGTPSLKFTAAGDGALEIQNDGNTAISISNTGVATFANNTNVTGDLTINACTLTSSGSGISFNGVDSHRLNYSNGNDIIFNTAGIYFQNSGATNGDPARTPTSFGVYLNNNIGYIGVYRNGGAAIICGRSGIGTVISIGQDGVDRGSIAVNGGTVTYNAFAGSHWSQLADGSKPELLRGTVMESIDELVEWPGENDNTERLCKVKVSDTAGSKKVYGVFMDWDHEWEATNDMLVTSLGAFVCRINPSVNVEIGDLLESNGDGTARVQSDDIIRSSTIGKVTGTTRTHEHADGSYCVPTVLYCG